ncbi:heme-binding protein [Roseateles sp.]|uniref:heme-binding protein n=1 Tax=Roseateles sp. TaxID=1971397 RepID=UPI0025D0EF50|nr:heme-binding protein [Roseateles sp.]MBV8035386.1 heme-binding protein [Roseateles sp.]
MRSLFITSLLTTVVVAHAEPASDAALATAEHLASAARAACRALGREVAVAVVDASGQTLLMSRSASVGPHNLEAARRKAYTALSTRLATLTLGRQVRSQPDTAALQYLPELLLLGGGVPWRAAGGDVAGAGGDVAGAVGVAGGGGPENDDACARTAVDSLRHHP